MINEIVSNIPVNITIWIVIKIIFIVIITIILSKICTKIYDKSKFANTINFRFLRVIVRYTIYLCGILACIYQLPNMGKLANTLLAGSGIFAAAIGLGAQEAFGNVVSGIILSTSKPFDIGDRIIIKSNGENITGYVEDITLRHTVIRTYYNTEYILTNSQLDNMIIENTTRNNNNQGIVDFIDIVVSYESDIEKAISIMQEIIGNHKNFYDIREDKEKTNNIDKVTVRIRSFDDNGISLRASVRTHTIDESFSTCSECRLLIKKEFDKQGIEIPYNKVIIVNQNSSN